MSAGLGKLHAEQRVESSLLAYAPKKPAGRKPPTRLAVLALLALGPFDLRDPSS
jgi:hypothetical protein